MIFLAHSNTKITNFYKNRKYSESEIQWWINIKKKAQPKTMILKTKMLKLKSKTI